MRSIAFTLLLLGSLLSSYSIASDTQTLWQGIKEGKYVVLMRHATAPGFGDPEYFRVEDCSTQRNLSEAGRQQARKIGDSFRDYGIDQANLYSSQWCRCLETARLLALGDVTELPIINSFFQKFERREKQTQALRQWLQQQAFSTPTVLVTHQVNITALTGVTPASGEMVVIQVDNTGNITTLGQLSTPPK